MNESRWIAKVREVGGRWHTAEFNNNEDAEDWIQILENNRDVARVVGPYRSEDAEDLALDEAYASAEGW